MARFAELSVLFACFVALAASGSILSSTDQKIKPVSEADLDELVKEQKGKTTRDVSCTASCPFGWVKFDNRCFTYFTNPEDWYTAETYCVNLGANLASIHSDTENQLVKSLIRSYDHDENPTWIGLTDCQKNFGWVWSDGSRFDFTKWNSDEPNNNNGECCVNINWSWSTPEKMWNDNPCDQKYPFVCVKRLG